MSSPSGQRTLQHSGDVLDTQVVVNPSLDFACSEVRPDKEAENRVSPSSPLSGTLRLWICSTASGVPGQKSAAPLIRSDPRCPASGNR